MTKQRGFAVFYGAILTVVTLVAIEAIASFFVPPWPARALRSIELASTTPDSSSLVYDKRAPVQSYNSWGMYDRERTLGKSVSVRFRSVFVGDSILEFALSRWTLPASVERQFAEAGVEDFEAVNLSISGTDPKSYYYRVHDIALGLSPDAIVVSFFSGNDFMTADQAYSTFKIPPLVDELPGASLLGSVMPRTNWLIVNRLRLSEFLRSNVPIPNELKTLNDIVQGPPQDRIPRLVAHMRRYYYPSASEEQLSEILSRGGEAFWRTFKPREIGQEYLMGWLVNLILKSELDASRYHSARNMEDAAHIVSDDSVQATLSWLSAMDRATRAAGVPLLLMLVPAPIVDPDFVEFWKLWPGYLSWFLICEESQDRLVAMLRKTPIRFFDLRDDLRGVRGAYRKSDGHWTEKGVEIAADRARAELTKLMKPE